MIVSEWVWTVETLRKYKQKSYFSQSKYSILHFSHFWAQNTQKCRNVLKSTQMYPEVRKGHRGFKKLHKMQKGTQAAPPVGLPYRTNTIWGLFTCTSRHSKEFCENGAQYRDFMHFTPNQQKSTFSVWFRRIVHRLTISCDCGSQACATVSTSHDSMSTHVYCEVPARTDLSI